MTRDSLLGIRLDNRYLVISQLGSGGMGEVFLAEHEALGRQVAIKVLRRAFEHDREQVERFRREARAASRLDHPNIVHIADFGKTADDRFYLVMEYVDGGTLRALLSAHAAQPLPLDWALSILAQIADALSSAHDAGVIHRDLKPENIKLAVEGPGLPHVKILDFGLAKIIGDKGAVPLTRPGQIFGTPPYMSPEQFAGEELDSRTDIYSLGILAYEILAGRLPFHCNTVRGYMIAHASTAPPELSDVRPVSAPDLPPGLEPFVMQCLAKDRDDRPLRASDLHNFLSNCLRGLKAAKLDASHCDRDERDWETAHTGVVDPVSSTSARWGSARSDPHAVFTDTAARGAAPHAPEDLLAVDDADDAHTDDIGIQETLGMERGTDRATDEDLHPDDLGSNGSAAMADGSDLMAATPDSGRCAYSEGTADTLWVSDPEAFSRGASTRSPAGSEAAIHTLPGARKTCEAESIAADEPDVAPAPEARAAAWPGVSREADTTITTLPDDLFLDDQRAADGRIVGAVSPNEKIRATLLGTGPSLGMAQKPSPLASSGPRLAGNFGERPPIAESLPSQRGLERPRQQALKHAKAIARALRDRRLGSIELTQVLVKLDEAEERQLSVQTSLALVQNELDELNREIRDREYRIRHALIDLRMERDRLAEERTYQEAASPAETDALQATIEDLDQQIRALDSRLGSALQEHRSRVEELESRRSALQSNLTVLAEQERLKEQRLIELILEATPAVTHPQLLDAIRMMHEWMKVADS